MRHSQCRDRKSTRLNSSHGYISYAVFCLKKKTAIGVSTGSTGFSKIFYEFTSAAANNGSDFLGATGNTPFFNISTALVMFIGRFAPIGLLLALAGSMIKRNRSTEIGLRTDSITFTIVLVGSILLLVVLTFFPFLALGPILEFFQKRVNGF